MSKRVWSISVLVIAALAGGCTSVQSTSYGDGWVKSSPVSHGFVAPPQLQSMQGRSYHVTVVGAKSDGGMEIGAFQQHGMVRCDSSRADVGVRIELGAPRQGDPGAMQLGNKWYPAFEVSVPYTVAILRSNGELLDRREARHSSMLTFKNVPGFASRDEAVRSIDVVRKLGARGVEDQAATAALAEAKTTAHSLGAALFEQRNLSIEVPVVRAAGGVDLESAYERLAKANGPEAIRAALSAYEQAGTSHVKPDGSPNQTANYGVACGIAAAKVMLLDLPGAWQATKLAVESVPAGKEAKALQRLIYEQERATGQHVIPEGERPTLEDGLRGMLSKPPR